MTRRLTAIVERAGDGYMALCPELDVASQGETVAEARDNLAEAIALFFETAPPGEVHRRLRGEVYVTQIEEGSASWGASSRLRPVRGPADRDHLRLSHPDCRRLLTLIVALHSVRIRGELPKTSDKGEDLPNRGKRPA